MTNSWCAYEVTNMSYDKCKRNVMCYNSWHVH